jgi:hypothetical protein
MKIRCDRRRYFIRAALLGAVAVLSLIAVSTAQRDARAAASAPAPAKVSEVMVYSAADEFSQLIETVRDGGALAPIAESSGPGGMKWFMVRTRRWSSAGLGRATTPKQEKSTTIFAQPRDGGDGQGL